MKVCIIGAGVTGLSLLLLLTRKGVNPSDITIIDPQFRGGDLGEKWANIQSNTLWSKTVDALNGLLGLTLESSQEIGPLSKIADLFVSLTSSIPVNRIQGFVKSVAQENDEWKITYYTHFEQSMCSKVLFACQGSNQRILNLPIPSIPIECALDKRIADYILPGDRVIVYGTNHSGTLIIKNLHDLSASVTAVYRSENPFVWARDGAYDGIKEEAADIADKIVAGTIPVTLIRVSDDAAVKNATYNSKWVIYAIGFERRSIPGLPEAYDGNTATIGASAWGFGIAYPNAAPDGVKWDVSVAAFLNHMNAQMPVILASLE